MNSGNNITHVRGLYSLDETVPISKFVYHKDRSYLREYNKKKNANQIRRDCFRSMNRFEPVYYVKMMEYQQIQEKAKYQEPYRVPFFLDVDILARNSNDLQCPHFSRYSNSKNINPSSLSWLPEYQKQKKQKRIKRSQSVLNVHKKYIITSPSRTDESNDRHRYYEPQSPYKWRSPRARHSKSNLISKSEVNSLSFSNSPNSSSQNSPKIRRPRNYSKRENEFLIVLLKKYFEKWHNKWSLNNSIKMNQMKTLY